VQFVKGAAKPEKAEAPAEQPSESK